MNKLILLALIGASAEAMKLESGTDAERGRGKAGGTAVLAETDAERLLRLAQTDAERPYILQHFGRPVPMLAQTADDEDDSDEEEENVNLGMDLAARFTNKVHDVTDCFKEWKQADERYRNQMDKGADAETILEHEEEAYHQLLTCVELQFSVEEE